MAFNNKFPNGAEFFSDAVQSWLTRVSIFLTKIDTSSDIIIDNTLKGIVLKSPNNHYWRVTISNLGALITTDLGTTKP